VDGDGHTEIVVRVPHSNSKDPAPRSPFSEEVYLLTVDGKLKWKFPLPAASEYPRYTWCDDIDDDGNVEIIFGGTDGRFDAFTIGDAKDLRSRIVVSFQQIASEWDAPIEEQRALFSLLQERERKPFGFMEVRDSLQLHAPLKAESVFEQLAQAIQRMPELYSKFVLQEPYIDDEKIEERIEQVEQAVNFQFPASYVSFMRQFGGGGFRDIMLHIAGPEQRLILYSGPFLQGNTRAEAMQAVALRTLGTENMVVIGTDSNMFKPIVFLRGCPTIGDEYAIGVYSDWDFFVDILAYTFPELIQSVLSKL